MKRFACQRGHSSYCPICNSSGEKKCSQNWVITPLGGNGGGGGGDGGGGGEK